MDAFVAAESAREGSGGAVFVGAVIAVACPSCWPGVVKPLSRGPLVGLDNAPGVPLVMTLGSAWEVRSESALVGAASTKLRARASDAGLVPTGTGEAKVPFGSLVEAIALGCAVFASATKVNPLAVAIRPKN